MAETLLCPCGGTSFTFRQYTQAESPVMRVTEGEVWLGEASIDWEATLRGEVVCDACLETVDIGERRICS